MIPERYLFCWCSGVDLYVGGSYLLLCISCRQNRYYCWNRIIQFFSIAVPRIGGYLNIFYI
ncbi:unnamed protein product [Brugia timori]|uniref:Uncharacterized protein n=1 Tax=Brugia timori TaxID=42155 RepID=A0A0R3QIE5_9BILA|nr:unnamed protein product [Brugia timori]